MAPTPAGDGPDTRRLYLDLLKRALTHTLYWPPDLAPVSDYASEEFKEAVRTAYATRQFIDLPTMRAEGRDWPRYAQTMVGLRRLENVEYCVERVIHDDVPGDLIEAGAWRGGVVIFMRGVLKAHGIRDRKVLAADSFRGLPKPNPSVYPADTGDTHHVAKALAVSVEDVERNFEMYGLLDGQVEFLEGWFRDTLPNVRERTWAVIRIDGDLYESTMDALVNLYPGLSTGGYLIVDDFAHDACRQAVEDFRTSRGIEEVIEPIDWTGVFWRRRS